jgi:integrase
MGRAQGPGTYRTGRARDGLLSIYDKAAAMVPPQPWHSLRHTFGTELASAGVPVTTIKEDEARAGVIMAAIRGAKSEMGPSWARSSSRKEKNPC